MCDTVAIRRDGTTTFAKNSDRPVGEAQVVERLPRRPGGGTVRTQYLELPDAGAYALVGSRPVWLWGLEHGVNEHGVAIGNERVWTTDDPAAVPPALIGMDLVRLGLERARTATEAVDVMVDLLERHGQGGAAEGPDGEPYFSSFLVADHRTTWVLETSARTWVAQERTAVAGSAISNRVSIGTDWTRAGAGVAPGTDFDRWRDPAWSPIADVRLACTVPAVIDEHTVRGAADLVALLRHHGDRPWGRPGDDPADLTPVPEPELGPDGRGVTVCMHVRDLHVTAASMVCELPEGAGPGRIWAALGSPCATVYVPVAPPGADPAPVDARLASPRTWARFDALRRRVEGDPTALADVRSVLGPLEAWTWRTTPDDPDIPDRVDAALAELGA